MKRFFTLTLAALLAMMVTVQAQKRNINLTLQVVGPSNEAITDANIALQQTDYSLSYGTLHLNSEGQLTVKIYPGNHSLEVSKLGYVTNYSTFNAVADTSITVQLAEENQLPYALTTSVTHDAVTGLDDVLLTWNQEPPVFFDSFEDYEAFSINFGQWTGIDGDGLVTAPLVGEYINRGVMQYAQIINPMTVIPAWWYDYPILRPYNGQQYVGFVRTYSGAANDDWLISPTITPGSRNVLSFMAKAADQYKEKFQVYITENVDNPGKADFTMINSGNYESADYKGWQEFTYDLSAYAGKPIKFAIRYISEYNNGGSFMLMVDDVYVGQNFTNMQAPRKSRRIAKSPTNPNESFNIYLNGNKVGETEEFEYTFEQLSPGTYTLGVQAVYSASTTDIVTTTITLTNNNGHLVVNVGTNNGQSADGATVELINRASTATYSAVIEQGKADFASVPFGNYLLGITAPHFNVYDAELAIDGDKTLDVVLSETIIDPYNITADPDSTGHVTVKWNQNISFIDSFEDYPDFATGSFGEWNTYDLDMHNVYPIGLGSSTNIVTFPGASTPTEPRPVPPMVFNPWHTTPPMLPTDPAIQAPTGEKSIIFFSPQNNGANKWLVAPPVTIRDGFVCRLTAKAYSTYPESMEICVFPTGGDPGLDNYEPIASIDPLSTGVWTIYESDLAAYVGQTVRVAVHYTSFDAFLAQVDDFYIGNGDDEGSTLDVGWVDHYEIYLDGTLKGTSQQPEFTLSNVPVGTHKVGIKAIYTSGASTLVEYEFVVAVSNIPGDIDGDGEVNGLDINKLINIVLGKASADSFGGNADLNGDGDINGLDINALINIILGK